MGRPHLVAMGEPDPALKSRYAGKRTQTRKALGVKPTTRGGPKKNRRKQTNQENTR